MFDPSLWVPRLFGAVIGAAAAVFLLLGLGALWPVDGELDRRWVVVPASVLVVVTMAALFARALAEANRVTYHLAGPEALSR